MRILVVEDEKSLALVIKARLEKEKYMVDIATDGEDGLYNVMTNAYDLVILDVMLPYVDGFTILSKAKKNNITAKLVMLTAKSMIDDKLNGLNNGADDYITKPFHIEEVVARINNLLRKNSKLKDYIEYHDLRLNLKDSSITCTKTNESINIGNSNLAKAGRLKSTMSFVPGFTECVLKTKGDRNHEFAGSKRHIKNIWKWGDCSRGIKECKFLSRKRRVFSHCRRVRFRKEYSVKYDRSA